MPRTAWPALGIAAALALGSAVSLGTARFSYGLMLPPMRADLGWSYATAGAMNTVNAAGYLAGALLVSRAMRRFGVRAVLVAGTVATALALAAHGLVASDGALYALRFATGLVSALSLVAGAVLAARVVGLVAAAVSDRPVPSGLVLGMYYGGTGLGIVASTLLVPVLIATSGPHPWQPAWLGIGAMSLLAAAVLALATRDLVEPAHATAASDATRRFAWRDFTPALVAYLLFGLGYIGYMTFVITLLRERHVEAGLVNAFFLMLGLAVLASSWLWARMLRRFRGGESMCILNGLLAAATVLPVLSAQPVTVFASGLLFGSVFLSLVTSTTALIRHNLPHALWAAGISAFTIVFATGQIVGPVLVGLIADRFGGLGAGFLCSAAALALGSLAASRQKPLPLATT